MMVKEHGSHGHYLHPVALSPNPDGNGHMEAGATQGKGLWAASFPSSSPSVRVYQSPTIQSEAKREPQDTQQHKIPSGTL